MRRSERLVGSAAARFPVLSLTAQMISQMQTYFVQSTARSGSMFAIRTHIPCVLLRIVRFEVASKLHSEVQNCVHFLVRTQGRL